MISIDRKVCHDVLRVTNDYNASVLFDPAIGGYAIWHMSHPETASVISSVPINEVPGALRRLEKQEMIKKIQGAMNGAVVFRITPELLHAKTFWWDRFTKTYVAGFISGVLITVASGLLLHLLTGSF